MKKLISKEWISRSRRCTVLLPGLCALLFCFTSCQSMEKEKDKKNAAGKKEDRFQFLKDQEKRYKHQDKEESIEVEQVKEDSSLVMKGKVADKIKAIPVKALTAPPEKAKAPLHFYDDFIILNGEEEMEVNLVFNNAPLLDVLPSFADALGFNFLADSDLRGVVTLNIDQKMTRKDLWNTFDRMLNLAGAGVVVEGTVLRIMSLNKVGRASDSRLSRDGSGELLYYPLKNTLAREAMQQIRQFTGTGATVVELTRPNALMIADDRANMPKIKQVLEHLDMAGKAGWKRQVIQCNHILPSKLTEELIAVLPVLGFNVYKKTDRTEQPGSVQLTGIDRLQLIVVSAATDEAVKEIRQWVDLLDNADQLDQERVFVYKVRNSKALNLTHALAMIYDMQGSSLSIDANNGNTRTDNINSTNRNTRNNTRNTRNNRNNTQASVRTDNTTTDLRSSVFDTPVRVFADGVLNRLVIRTTPRTYASIKALLQRLDVVPAQVLLQVLVVEVTLSENTKFGLELSALAKDGKHSATLLGTNYSNITKPLDTSAGTIDGSGFSALLEDPKNPNTRFGYLQALAGNGAIKVVSSPQLLVSSHTKAEINVGTQVPVVTSAITSTSADGNLQKGYKYEDTGIILTVTPQVTSTNLISLKVKQILSDVTANPDPNVENPYINQRSIETAMTIANGRTMIIGGLIQEKVNDNLASLPLLRQIPLLNRLLGSTDASVERSEVLVLITGYIINEKSKLEEMITRYNDAIEALNKFERSTGKDGRQHRTKFLTDKDFWKNGTFLQ